MKLRRIFAAIAACAVAATMAVSASAADKPYWSAEVKANKADACMLNGLDIDYSKVDKVVVAIESDGNLTKGIIGGNTIAKFKENGEDPAKAWDATAEQVLGDENDANAVANGEFVWDKIGGLNDADSLQVQWWWTTATTVTINSVKIYDASGAVLFEYTYTPPAETPKDPSSSETPKDPSSSEAPKDPSSTGAAGGTTNPTTGATAGLALAGLAIAGAAVVAAKKSK